MKLTRLKIAGFKSFADAVDIRIEVGLTGIVGPNGCGKSNLVEALRWVMGEASHKNLRASTMDDVIFAGTNRRATRSHAEVMLTLDNTSRTAPVIFNDADILEVSRKIISGEGSHYRINGREVRARDVQLLFADAATGSRSSALVRQGQIAEIIAAKPQARRAILEDAAGIGGLYTRRREAEARLKAADENLLRIEDVLREIDSQLRRLDVQAKQAERYKQFSADIRAHEAQILTLTWIKVRDHVITLEQDLNTATLTLTQATVLQAQTAKDQAVIAYQLEPLRVQEHEKAEALQKIKTALSVLNVEEKRLYERTQEIAKRIQEVERDEQREHIAFRDAKTMVERISAELNNITRDIQHPDQPKDALQQAHHTALLELKHAEGALAVKQVHHAKRNAEHAAAIHALSHEKKRFEQLSKEQENNKKQRQTCISQADTLIQFEILKQQLSSAQEIVMSAQTALDEARAQLKKAQEQEQAARQPHFEAEKRAQRLETELRTLQKLFAPHSAQQWSKIIDQIKVKKGYEIALGAVFGDDLDASDDALAPIYWTQIPHFEQDCPLIEGVTPLSELTTHPLALERALKQVGVVTYSEGERLHKHLKVGQTLVSQAGDLWRWDGLIVKAEAPNQTAKRLAEKNRLSDLEVTLKEANIALLKQQSVFGNLQEAVKTSVNQETRAFEALRHAQKEVERTRNQLSNMEHQVADLALKQASLDEAIKRCDLALTETQERLEQLINAQKDSAQLPHSETELEHAYTLVLNARQISTKAHTDLHQYEREQTDKLRLCETLKGDLQAWQTRLNKAQNTLNDLGERSKTLQNDHSAIQDAPDTFMISRRRLLSDLEEAEAARNMPQLSSRSTFQL